MKKSLLYRLCCYKAFGYKYVSDGFFCNQNDVFFENLELLKSEILQCNLCELCKTRTNVLSPSGNEKAKIMLVFESPSVWDDKDGNAFSGQSGEKFREIWYQNTGLSVSEIYTSFLIKCKISQRLNSKIILSCVPYLNDEIRLIKPSLVVMLGDICSKIILRNERLPDMALIHGSIFKDGGISFMPTFDMNFINQNPSKISLFENDLQKIREFV